MDNLPSIINPSNFQPMTQSLPQSEERIDPGIMSFLMQASMAAQMTKMRKMEESRIPTGSISRKFSISDSLFTFDIAHPWISYSLTNLGPDDVYVRENELEGEITDGAPVEPGDVYDVDFRYPMMRRLYIQAEDGGTATVKVKAQEGRQEGGVV